MCLLSLSCQAQTLTLRPNPNRGIQAARNAIHQLLASADAIVGASLKIIWRSSEALFKADL